MIDIHCHLQDEKLGQLEKSGFYGDTDVKCAIVNGTSPADWKTVEKLAKRFSFIKPAYGVHPWKIDGLPDDWDSSLYHFLKSGAVSVGEIGFDSWIEPRDEERQNEICYRQLEMAEELSLPPTLHVLKAWDRFEKALKEKTGLKNGFLVHGFSGSLEIMQQIVSAGGFLSFSAYAADPKRKRMREAIRETPLENILIETDAPDMLPPQDWRLQPLVDGEGNAVNHPGNILKAYELIAQLKNMELFELREKMEGNARRLFDLSES